MEKIQGKTTKSVEDTGSEVTRGESVGTTPVPRQTSSSGENGNDGRVHCSSSKEYVAAVSHWLLMYQAHYMAYYNMVVAPYYMSMGYAQASAHFMNMQNSRSSESQTQQSQSPQNGGNAAQRGGISQQGQRGTNGPQLILAREFNIPSIYRRIIAEVIDFLVLFSLKVGITLFAIVYLGIGDESKFAMQFLVEEFDEDSSLEDLQQVLTLALIYRIFVCLYETIFLKNTLGRTSLGGATPGKLLLGLRVISCERVVTREPSRVQVFLAENLTYTQAFFRALIKNFSMAFFFPACMTVFFNPHNRATYDILTKTVVVSADSSVAVNRNQNQR